MLWLSVTWGDAWQTTFVLFLLHLLFTSSVMCLSLPCQISPHLYLICFLSFHHVYLPVFLFLDHFLLSLYISNLFHTFSHPLLLSPSVCLQPPGAAWTGPEHEDIQLHAKTPRHSPLPLTFPLDLKIVCPLRFNPQTPSPLALTFLNSFCKYMFTQCKWMVSTAVKTVHFTMWNY